MRSIEIEMWANGVLDSMDKLGHTEDHRVELKREWIDGRQAARRLAGHANSAPDDVILWLIGVDEKAGKVVGVQAHDLAQWWPQVEAEFADHIAPEMTAVAMRRDEIPFMALAFKTDRAPYLVRNEEFGKIKGQNMAWEVPFRVGTEVRTATRNQLLSLLTPSLSLPRHELVGAGVVLNKPVLKERWMQKCIADANFYLVSTDDRTITLDSRSCEVTVEIPGLLPSTPLGIPHLNPTAAPNVDIAGHMCRIIGTALMHLKVEGDVPSIGNQYAEQLRLSIKIRPIGFDRSITLSCLLNIQPSNSLSGVTHSFGAPRLLVV